MKTKFTLAFIVCCIAFSNLVDAQVNKQDSLALVALYNSTDGAHWKNNLNWFTKAPLLTWYGVGVYNNRVTSLTLKNNNLNGSLVEDMNALTALGYLVLSNNNLTGNIPAAFFKNFAVLDQLYLDHNQLTGSVPAFSQQLGYMHYLDFDHNQLSGPLPDSLVTYTGIRILDLSNNQFSGSISTTFGRLNCQFLYLNNNQLSGSIPASLANNPLDGLRLGVNRLSGNIPSITSNYLYELQLDHNQFTGSIPDTLSTYTYFSILRLDHNQLSGSIPASLSKHAWLDLLNLQYNHLSGTIPSNFFKGKYEFGELNLSHNNLSGTIPNSLLNIKIINELNLSNNNLNGKIPANWSNQPWIQVLDLSHNQLSDTIPSGIGNLKTLKTLLLSDNKLSGNIPASFSELTSLRYLRVNLNLLSGTIPASIGSLLKLNDFTILKNRYNFDGLETFVTNNKIDTFKYDEQKKIAINQEASKLSVYAGGTLSNNTYNWYRDSSLVTTISGDSTFMPSTNGVYYVTVTNKLVTGLTLYSDTISFDGNNSIIASAADNKLNSLSVYPNPATTTATLSFKASGKYTVIVTGLSGISQLNHSGVAGKGINTVTLPVNRLSASMYMVTVTDETGKKQLVRLSKQ